MATIVKITEELANAYREYVKYDKVPHKDNAELFVRMKDLTRENSILRVFIIRLKNHSSYSDIVSYLDNTDLEHYHRNVDIKSIELDDNKLSEFVDIVHTVARDTVKKFEKENIDISGYLRKNLWEVIGNFCSCKSNSLRRLNSCIYGYFVVKYELTHGEGNEVTTEVNKKYRERQKEISKHYDEYVEKLANF